jgi:hypothetical protein
MKTLFRSALLLSVLTISLPLHSLFAQRPAASVSNKARHVYVQNREAAIFPNIAMHPDPANNQTEMSIAIHPTNPNIVLAGSNTGQLNPRLNQGWYVTTDGGTSWVGDTLPNFNSDAYSADPAVTIDLQGNLFFASLRSPLTRGSSDDTTGIYVSRSTDNGNSWRRANIVSGVLATSGYDKDHLIVDVNPGSPYAGYVYSAFSNLPNVTCSVAWPIVFSQSTDHGQTFSGLSVISGSVAYHNHGVNLATGPGGELYATWVGYGNWCSMAGAQLVFNSSKNGGATWGQAASIRTITPDLTKGVISMRSFPSMALDRSSGPRRGWIYIVYPEKAPTTPDIFLIRSTDGGTSWSTPRKVNQDATNNDQFHSWMSVDPSTGALYVVYYDSRNFPANDSAEVYVSASFDGGDTFADMLVSDVPFLPGPVPNPYSYGFGEYIGISALKDTVWPCWYDNRTGTYQAYTTKIVYDFPFTGVQDLCGETVPRQFSLDQNYPNPFNPTTAISYQLATNSYVTLKALDMLGREVATLVNEKRPAGTHSVQWNAKGLPSGVYFCRMTAGGFVETKMMVLLK